MAKYYVRRYEEDDVFVYKIIDGRYHYLSARREPKWLPYEIPVRGGLEYASIEALFEADVLPPEMAARLLQAEI